MYGKSYSLENSLRALIFREDLFLYNCLKAYNLLLEAEKYSREELFLERAKLGWDSMLI